jgi:hypothetical protein
MICISALCRGEEEKQKRIQSLAKVVVVAAAAWKRGW